MHPEDSPLREASDEPGDGAGAARGASLRELPPLLPGDAAAIARYREEGWAPLGRTLDDAALEALRARADALMLGEVVVPGMFFQRDASGGGYEELPRGRGYSGPTLDYRKLEKLERDPIFREAIEFPRFGSIARAVLGPSISLYRAVLFNKSAAGGTHLPWHQDAGSFWGLSRDPELQIWTALDDVPEESGCLELVPRSHLGGLATPLGGVIPDYVSVPANAEARLVRVPARAGESLLIHNYLWHRSGRNSTGKPRRALTICLLDAATRCRRAKNPRQFVRLWESDRPGADR